MSRKESKMRLLEPEVDGKPKPLYSEGSIPDLRRDLRESLSESLHRMQHAANRIKRAASANADLYERAATESEIGHENTVNDLKGMGV